MITKFRCAVVLVLVLAASVAQAQTLPWVDSPGEGGVKDTTTGLVWVDYRVLSDSWWTWPTAMSNAANLVHMGYTDWRLPTVAELQDAGRKQIYQNVPMITDGSELPTSPPRDSDTGYWYWSSESTKKKGGQAWAVKLNSTTQKTALWTQGFSTAVMVVRQGSR